MDSNARTQLDVEIEDRLIRKLSHRCDPRWRVDLPGYLPRLVQMLNQSHDRPMTEYAEAIRTIMREHSRVDHGDSRGEIAKSLNRHVKLVIETLEQIRVERLERGQWSDAPVPPLMCG
jgi:hypothetical protein